MIPGQEWRGPLYNTQLTMAQPCLGEDDAVGVWLRSSSREHSIRILSCHAATETTSAERTVCAAVEGLVVKVGKTPMYITEVCLTLNSKRRLLSCVCPCWLVFFQFATS